MKLTGIVPATLVAALTTVSNGCAPGQSQPSHQGQVLAEVAGPPVIESVRPDSVVLPAGSVAEVTLTGTGFVVGEPGQNTVRFNGAVFKSVASREGRTILFNIPDVISYGGGAPPST